MFLFNRKSVRFFRKDGHDWRKKSDGKTVRETHEKLKVGMCLYCIGSSCEHVYGLPEEHALQHFKLISGIFDVQVGNKDVLNCYYAHAEDSLQVCHDDF